MSGGSWLELMSWSMVYCLLQEAAELSPTVMLRCLLKALQSHKLHLTGDDDLLDTAQLKGTAG